ncbi:GNAT family N-acetyltransferase [Neobacillus sp. YIM B06451]|uniref:GNAT family N-acetyltransferase n=1 Tax=Neobacillus sp. YIM B06451 TaxID=3070994 RepID=UPI00292F1639|nr:GNAT family N-acetyltransferase [Neobacillus sp. YIM B06451]
MAFRFVKGYRQDPVLRESFFSLARSIFGIQFNRWYEMGFWTDKYIPYSYCDGENIIANVSVNRIGLVMDGVERRGLQIGTVMVHPDFRGLGLSRRLMEFVLDDFEGKYDVMYLFANQSVLDFYPKFGFVQKKEFLFSLSFKRSGEISALIRKLNMEDVRDRQFLFQFAKRRIEVSRRFTATDTQELLMFYCLNVFSHCIYYLEDEECIAIYEEDAGELQLFDLISISRVDLHSIVAKIAGEKTEKIIFHFMPEDVGLRFESHTYQGNETLFVRMAEGVCLPEKFKHPLTAQA